ncbi:hypothetical protein ACJIZ3_024143 [Penstemon smallii]|uniref:SANTA domain-containing protein n=1 Tax=Penstemon smallii TaxID=265156 RepID=A0ABD3TQZ5_9LAMI
MKSMTSALSPCVHNNCGNIPKSRFQTTVFLDDWWLVKAENDDLQSTRVAIAGRCVCIGVKGKQPMRVFSSLPILKRYDEFTLETTDGKCVIIKGSINKARTSENGFPSDVCNHFMYGFPSYWKEYAEKFMLIESHCKGVSGVTENLSSPKVGEQPLVGSHDNDLGSQDTMNAKNAKGMEKREKPILTEEILSHTEGNLDRDVNSTEEILSHTEGRTTRSKSSLKMKKKKKSAKSKDEKIRSNYVSSSMGSDKVDFSSSDIEPGGGRNDIQFEVTGLNGCANKKNLIELDSGFVKDKFEQIAETPNREKDLKRVKRRGIAHKEMQKSTSSLSTLSPAYNEKQTVVADRTTRSKSSLKMKKKKKSAKSKDEKLRSNSVSSSMGSDKVDFANSDTEPGGGKNDIQFEVTGLYGCANKKNLIGLDSSLVKDKFEHIAETPNREKDLKRVKRRGIAHKEMQKSTSSLSTLSPAYNEKQTVVADRTTRSKSSLKMKKKKKSAKSKDEKLRSNSETPEKEKDEVPTDSPQHRSFNRSRSGRLLMPTLEFWRNQRAIYDADGTVTGIEEEIHEGQPKKVMQNINLGSGYASQRKRRRSHVKI